MPELIFEQSKWYVPVCLLLAAAISFLMYSKKAPWTILTNRMLLAGRFVLTFVLLLLLLNPLFNQLISDVEPPTVVVAVDNSLSMVENQTDETINALKADIAQLTDELTAKNFEVRVHTLTAEVAKPEDILFDQKITNLDQWLRKIQSQYEGSNLGAVYLISDGKYNQGTSPAYFPYNFKVLALGVGDTLQKQDVVLQNVLFNKIAYQGNKFPVVAEIVNHGFKDQKTRVEIRSQGKLLTSRPVQFNSTEGLARVELEVDADQNGMQQLDVRVATIAEESLKNNNARRIFVDVVDGKQKILLVAPTPHPDLKALAAVIEKNQNYDLTTYIPGVNDLKKEKFDLVISHQAYSRYRQANNVVQEYRDQGVPVWMIFGDRSNILMASRTESQFALSQRGAKRDQVFGTLNPDFKLFSWDATTPASFNNYPPVSVPYGEARIPANAEVLLYQRVGSIRTDRPLFYMAEDNGQKVAYMLAQGFWSWRMQEYAITESTTTFDNIFLKAIQYLSTKEDKRRFKFYPASTNYFENQTVRFHAEIYNQIYERIYGQPIDVKISGANGFVREYNFTPGSAYSRLEAANFPPGLYSYEATTILRDKKEVVHGKFSVKELQLEALDQVADFDLLRQVAFNTNGTFISNLPDAASVIDDYQLKGIVHSSEDIFPAIHLRWILLTMLALVSLEWFTRKYNGGY